MKNFFTILIFLSIFSTLNAFEKIDKKDKNTIRKSSKLFNKRRAIIIGYGLILKDDNQFNHYSFGVNALEFYKNTNFSYGFESLLNVYEASKNKQNEVIGTVFETTSLANYNFLNKLDVYYGLGFQYGNNNHNIENFGLINKIGIGYDLNYKFYLSLEYNNNIYFDKTKSDNTLKIKINIKY